MRRRPTREALSEPGPPIRLTDLAAIAGWSEDKIHADAKLGELAVKWARTGQRRMAMVERAEAVRYLRAVYQERAL